MKNLNLEIISPSGILFKGECRLAVVPSTEGDLGVMHGHEIIIATLREGKIDIYDDKEALIKSFDITSGIAKMQSAEQLLVLLDS